MKKEKIIGVIGGLGPEATLDFFAKLIASTNAKTDQEHLHVIINNNPKVPNRHASIDGTGPSAAAALIYSAKGLEKAGAEFLVMVCNTGHAYEKDIKEAVDLPFVSMIAATVKACLAKNPDLETVGILATDGALAANLYQQEFDKHNINCLYPNSQEQKKLMELVFKVKANEINKTVKTQMKDLANSLIEKGAQIIVAACTEIPLILEQKDIDKPLINSTDVLVDASISYARNS